jgi:hypothetical protein
MANQTAPPCQPEQSHKAYQAERAHKDFQASIETGRAATQVATLINGGAATAILTFLSKQMPPPPDVVKSASVSLLFYAAGVAFGALAMWISAHSSAAYAENWQDKFFAKERQETPAGADSTRDDKDNKYAKAWLFGHKLCAWLSIASFVLASGLIAAAFLRSGIIATVQSVPI